MYAQHIDYANLHYTPKSNGIAGAALYVARAINSLDAFSRRRRCTNIARLEVPCLVSVCGVCVYVFTQVDWIFNIHHTRISRHNHFISTYLPHSISTWFFFFYYYYVVLLVPPSPFEYSMKSPIYSHVSILGVICCSAQWTDCAVQIHVQRSPYGGKQSSIICACECALICRKVNHWLWKYGTGIYNAIIEGAVAFTAKNSKRKQPAAVNVMSPKGQCFCLTFDYITAELWQRSHRALILTIRSRSLSHSEWVHGGSDICFVS